MQLFVAPEREDRRPGILVVDLVDGQADLRVLPHPLDLLSDRRKGVDAATGWIEREAGALRRSAASKLTRMGESVLALNRGSSSTKFALFTWDASPRLLSRGTADGGDPEEVLDRLIEQLAADLERHPLAAVGHRIVHGGPSFREPHRVTGELIAALEGLERFAPNHLPDEMALIEAMQHRQPRTPQIVCFDTAFHAHMPE